MLLPLLLLLQANPVDAASTASVPQPCKLADGRGRLRDYPPSICDGLIRALTPPAEPPLVRASAVLEFEVTETGTVENCRIAEPSGKPEFDAKACTIATEKARYAAAPGVAAIKRHTKRLRVTWQTRE